MLVAASGLTDAIGAIILPCELRSLLFGLVALLVMLLPLTCRLDLLRERPWA